MVRCFKETEKDSVVLDFSVYANKIEVAGYISSISAKGYSAETFKKYFLELGRTVNSFRTVVI